MPKNVKRRKTIDISHMEISPLYYAGRAVTTLLRWLFLLAVAFIILYPLVYMLSMAFRSPKDFMDVTVIWIPKTPTLDNFKTAIGRVGMLRAMGYTVYISTVSSILQIFVTCLAGYGFARFRFKGNAVLFVMVILTIIVPPQMLGMPNYLLMKNFD